MKYAKALGALYALKATLRPETNIPSPAELVRRNPWISEADLYEYVDCHQNMLGALREYDQRPVVRQTFWRQENRLQQIWQRVEPPPAYEPPPYKP